MQKNMHIMLTNFAKTVVWKHGNDVKLSHHKQRTPNANDHHMTLNQTPGVVFSFWKQPESCWYYIFQVSASSTLRNLQMI